MLETSTHVLGRSVRVTEVIDADRGLVAVSNDAASTKTVSIQMLQQAGATVDVGDWIVIHMGFAMEAMTAAEAEATLAAMADFHLPADL